MTGVVLDTNVIVSAHLEDRGQPAAIFQLALAGRVLLYVSSEILAEYEEVLRRRRFSFNPQLVTKSLTAIRSTATLVKPRRTVTASVDPADNRFLECAEKAGANFLVTGNKRHFPTTWRQTRIVSPREFIELIPPELQR